MDDHDRPGGAAGVGTDVPTAERDGGVQARDRHGLVIGHLKGPRVDARHCECGWSLADPALVAVGNDGQQAIKDPCARIQVRPGESGDTENEQQQAQSPTWHQIGIPLASRDGDLRRLNDALASATLPQRPRASDMGA